MITEIAYGVIGVISLLVILLNIYGSRIQENHSITVSHEFPVPTATIYHNITDIEGQVAWWSELKAARKEVNDNKEIWHQTDHRGSVIPFETVESITNKKLVRRVADDKLPFGGTWTYVIDPVRGGKSSKLTITEDGYVRPPLFRSMMKFFWGRDSTLKSFMAALVLHINKTK